MLDLSPLSIIKKRKVSYLPPHFHTYQLENDFLSTLDSDCSTWIEYKLKGRYSITEKTSNSRADQLVIGFEDEKELTYFMLACPHIRR